MVAFKRFNFTPPLLVILLLMGIFWGPPLFRVMRNPQETMRLPSSYDIEMDTPIQQQISQATTPLLLVEFYQDACRTCQMLAPWLEKIERTPAYEACLHTVRINTQTPENQFFLELFRVEATPSLFVFEPSAMKKTPVQLPASLRESALKPLLQSTVKAHLADVDTPSVCESLLK